MAVLQAKKLSKVYNGVYALKDLDLAIEKGEIFCLLGQNGAGKTTTINLFLGFTDATTGTATINDVPVKPNDTATKKDVAYIPEVVQLYVSLTGIENLDFFSRLAGFEYSKEELSHFLTRANLQIVSHNVKLGNYSKGMRQKVGIAIAIAKDAKVILMDEPTSGLDPKATAEFTKICKELANDGKTIFMTTHDIFNAVNVGTKIGIMKEGTLVHILNTSEINANELQKLYLETI
jgi:ABC-2 type transport system ATP-binding protein